MRLRVTVACSEDRKADLRIASAAKAAVWEGAPVWEDQEHPLRGIHRDTERRFYFEVSAEDAAQVRRVIATLRWANRLTVAENPPTLGEGCQNCGNVAGPVLPTVCPNCDFRDISRCPNPECPDPEVPRREYVRVSGDRFRCPRCEARVRLRFNEPMFQADGSFNPPLVQVDLIEVAVAHETR